MKRYEFRVPCALSDTLAAAFPELDAVQIGPATTMLTGEIRDQSELHGMIARIGDLGLELLEVRQG
jgi:hypothetical protein